MTENIESVQTENSNSSISESPKWWIDETTPGNGNRPDWLAEKFKSVQDMAKSYKELEKSIGQVPDKYDFTKSQHLDPNYKPFQELQELARSKRVPQEVMDKFQESVDKYLNEFSVDMKEETEKLGHNAQERLITLNNWAKANLDTNDYHALTSSLRNAESVLALEKLRNKFMTANSQVPNGNDASNSEHNIDELQAELTNNLDKYKSDPKYRKELQARIAAVSQQSTFVDKNW